jgi:hypothetical protein
MFGLTCRSRPIWTRRPCAGRGLVGLHPSRSHAAYQRGEHLVGWLPGHLGVELADHGLRLAVEVLVQSVVYVPRQLAVDSFGVSYHFRISYTYPRA